ncbi:MAG: ABC transporter substrate-binding protein [bacterium]
MAKTKKWPSKKQWRQFFKTLSKKEKTTFFIFLFLALSSFLTLSFNIYFKNTEIAPASGGIFIEGVIGSPRFINPVYASPSDVDRDLTELVYSGLMKYSKEGEIVPDLAEEYKILEGGKVYEFYLKENLLWQDSQPLTVEDIIFTIKTIQTPSLKSPLRANWLGVKVEKISDLGVRFDLGNPSSIFLENCTLKILPKHIWQDISYQNFPLSIYNLKPVGSGPYKLKDLVQDSAGKIKSLDLVANQNYAGKSPNIPKITFLFFDTEAELIKAFKSGKIKGISLVSADQYQNIKSDSFASYRLSLPRYFALFFNLTPSGGEEKILADENIREALSYGTNKEEIIKEVLLSQGKVVNSPILPGIFGFEQPSKTYQFNQEAARDILESSGFTEKENGIREKILKKTPSFQFTKTLTVGSQGNEVTELQKCLAKDSSVYPEGEVTGYFGSKTKSAVIKFQEKYSSEILSPFGLTKGTGDVKTTTRAKLNELCAAPSEESLTLSFTLATVDQPSLVKTAELLKKQWQELGINLEIKTFDIATLEQEIIKPRNYEILLFGEVLGAIPDPFPFWHSSQIKDPGLNLAGYENKNCDKLLEEARQTLDETERKTALEKFQDLLIADNPALFLYSPDYLYLVSKEIKGVDSQIITDPSKRFSNIENWYIETKRVWR